VENKATLSFEKFRSNLINLRTRLTNYGEKYSSGFNNLLFIIKEQLKNAQKVIEINNPERQLKLGYSIATVKGKIIKSVKDVEAGQDLEVKVSDGKIISEIKKI
jgi:exodeoxyribonuclease VII large subunit